ncbi:hypothetical protein CFP56_000461 [Quercus suber]|uniref:Endonuclease/exonuclease/phosphatase domain-containing protein n=1 Tax=Quercus suber TaxID=58331 RepID=A0AAW0MAV7_QUESU
MTARCPAPRTFLFLLNPLAQERTTPTLSDLGLGPIHQTIPSNFSEMKILVWNCRGAGSTSFHRNFLDMTRRLRPAIAIIMETRISGTKAEEVSSSLSFNNVCRSDASSFSGGIWILWNAQDTDLDILSVTDQAIHAVVQTGLLKADHICTLGTGWRLGTGSLANLWVDNWSGRGPLRSMIHGPLSRNEELLKHGSKLCLPKAYPQASSRTYRGKHYSLLLFGQSGPLGISWLWRINISHWMTFSRKFNPYPLSSSLHSLSEL